MTRKAHTIRALLNLGEECGTHFAAMFPQWAHFTQDIKEWKAPTKKPSAKRIKKVKGGYIVEPKVFDDKEVTYQAVDASTTTTASVTFNTSNTWTSTGNGTGDTSF